MQKHLSEVTPEQRNITVLTTSGRAGMLGKSVRPGSPVTPQSGRPPDKLLVRWMDARTAAAQPARRPACQPLHRPTGRPEEPTLSIQEPGGQCFQEQKGNALPRGQCIQDPRLPQQLLHQAGSCYYRNKGWHWRRRQRSNRISMIDLCFDCPEGIANDCKRPKHNGNRT